MKAQVFPACQSFSPFDVVLMRERGMLGLKPEFSVA